MKTCYSSKCPNIPIKQITTLGQNASVLFVNNIYCKYQDILTRRIRAENL